MITIADNPNLAILEMAVQALGELTDSLVFVGGWIAVAQPIDTPAGVALVQHGPARDG